jgi:hypothetical protein
MLIMTMNGTVLVCLFIGYTAAFIIYGFDCDKDKAMAVNCCAWLVILYNFYDCINFTFVYNFLIHIYKKMINTFYTYINNFRMT